MLSSAQSDPVMYNHLGLPPTSAEVKEQMHKHRATGN